MPSLPPDVDPNIIATISPEQWNAWADGAEIGPAPHTLEKAAPGTDQTTSTSASPSTSDTVAQASFSTIAQHTTSPDPYIIYTCTFTSDVAYGTGNQRFKKGSQAQVLQERSLKDGRKVVKIKVEGIVYGNGKVRTGVWVPMVFIEKEETVVGNGDGEIAREK